MKSVIVISRVESALHLYSVATISLLLLGACTVLCYIAAGASLGLFFGGIVFATLMSPPLMLVEMSLPRHLVVAAAITDGVGVVWLLSVFFSNVTVPQWLGCYLILAVYVFSLWGLARGLSSLTCAPVAAAMATIIIGLLWLTWPIWLSPWMNQTLVNGLVPAHPLLVVNGLLGHLGIWTEHAIAYRLTNLDQDVYYALPRNLIPCASVHLLIGGGLLMMTWRRSTRQSA